MVTSVSGPSGAILWGYRSVATLRDWRYEPGVPTGTVTAHLEHADEYGLDQGPLVVSVSVGVSEWRWPVLAMRRDGATTVYTFTVGALGA